MFTTVPRTTTAEACADQLRRSILSGEVPAGDRLPPERTLAIELGVNRVTLRTAISVLTAEGLVVARQGSGTRVTDFRSASGPLLLGEWMSLATGPTRLEALRDLLAVRRAIGAAMLGRLAEVRPPIGPIREAVDLFGAAGDLDALAAADLAVVTALVNATGSPVYAMCLNPIAFALREDRALRAAIYRDPAANLLGWRALVAWLEDPVAVAIPMLTALHAARDEATLEMLRGAP